ncbi:MAG: fatty acid desaturase [Candidatus Kapabacteria bacterium]|nr:fatty acid desaturase [Candidatus Kapabacteria bacterium]
MSARSTYFNINTSPFWLMHLACFSAFFIEFSWWYVLLAVASYYLRMFFITGGYHRYFSHKTYSTSRVVQFIIAFMAQTSSQKGALWWAAHHRHHHKYSDMEEDIHSPKEGFWYAHMGWILSPENNATQYEYIRDLTRFKELVWLNEYRYMPVVVYAVAMFLAFGLPGLVWGFVIATTLLWHGTFTINSLSHTWGWQRYTTTDTSRNNPILALVTLGEGWHNNHHRFQASARNGFFWWEIDITYYVLKTLSLLGIVWDLRPVPQYLLDSNHESWIKNGTATIANAAEVAKQRVVVAAQSATQTASELAQTARTSVEEKVDVMKEKVDVVKEKLEESKEALAAQAGMLKESAKHQAEEIATKVENAVENALPVPKEKLA